MNIALNTYQNYCSAIIVAVAFILFGGLFTEALAQAGIDFTKGDQVGNGLITWIRKGPLVWFFSVALIASGIAAAMNKVSWMWFGLILVGAFIAFGSPKLVPYFAKQFG